MSRAISWVCDLMLVANPDMVTEMLQSPREDFYTSDGITAMIRLNDTAVLLPGYSLT